MRMGKYCVMIVAVSDYCEAIQCFSHPITGKYALLYKADSRLF
jgi:hypothetical protein